MRAGARPIALVLGLLAACSTPPVEVEPAAVQIEPEPQPVAKPEVDLYVNAAYGFSVAIPPGAPTCGRDRTMKIEGLSGSDYGLDIYLDSGPDGCDDLYLRPFIGVFGSFNTLEYATAAEAIASYEDAFGRPGPIPSDLGIPGREVAVGRWDQKDDWIYVKVAHFAGGILYEISLHTRAERLEADLERFRGVLRTVQYIEPFLPE